MNNAHVGLFVFFFVLGTIGFVAAGIERRRRLIERRWQTILQGPYRGHSIGQRYERKPPLPDRFEQGERGGR